MITNILLGLVASLIGIGLSMQGPINATLARGLGAPVLAATISFAVGTLGLIAVSLASGQLSLVQGSWRSIAPVYWIAGGLLGAAFVTATVYLVPRIGVATLAAFVIAGQFAAAVIIDHYGLINVAERSFTLARGAGVILLFVGALLVSFG
jgi:transporter family-2 protein